MINLSDPPTDGTDHVAPARQWPASGVQLRFWLLHELYSEAAVCNEAIAVRLRGTLDVRALETALSAIVARHDSLRAGFHRGDDGVVMRVEPGARLAMRQLDLRAEPEPVRAARLDALLRQEPTVRFDLARPPLVRATLVRLAADEHVLVLVFHHIVADGTAFLKVFPSELAALYPALASGGPLPPLPWPPSYEGFVQDEASVEARGRAAADLAHWRAELADAPAALALPTDRAHPPRPSGRGVRVLRHLPPPLRAGVVEQARALGVRPFDVGCAAFLGLLARYSDERDLVIGSPIANRSPAFKQAVGCFINTLVLRARLDDTSSLGTLSRQVRERWDAARAHGQVSFGDLLDELGGTRDPARSPVYQAMFNYMGFSVGALAIDGLHVEAWRLSAGTALLDLSCDLTEEADGGYGLCIEANTDVFDVAHAERMADHYERLLAAAIAAPEAAIWTLPLVGPDEQATIEAAATGPVIEPEETLFPAMVAARAAADGERLAARSDLRRLSYRELIAEANALAHALVARGVAPGELVLLGPGDDGCDTLVMILAILFAGGAYVPLDGTAPAARHRAVQADSGARWLLAGCGHDAGWRPAEVDLIEHDRDALDLARDGARAPVAAWAPEQPAYLMYTSGSTGRPKGVVVSHRNLAHQCRARLARYADPPARLLATYSFAFDSSVAGLSWALCTGGELRFAGELARRDPAALRRIIDGEAITHLDMVPSLYAAVLDGAQPAQLRSLRTVISGGEGLPAELVRRHFELAPGVRLFNEYGPTEATVFATVHDVVPADADARPPIGRPVGNTQCWVLDGRGELVPFGHTGELCIGGGGVAVGYHRRPEETARAFPPAAGARGRLYRTGDVARFRPDGLVELVGRSDEQVQVRGYRVELGEVEAALRRAPGVKDGTVILREDRPGEPRLVGYVVLDVRAEADVASIRRQLAADLPSYMVPTALVVVDRLERTSRGKIDRRALPPPPAAALAGAGQGFVPPRGEAQRNLVRLWQRLLGRTQIGATDDFFALGGNSLLAVKLVDAIDKEMGCRVRLAEVFQNPSVEALASVIARDVAPTRWRCLEIIRDEGEGLPLFFVGSTAQARAVASHLGSERPVYGLNIFGLHEPGAPVELTLASVAAAYVEEIRQARPHGPYCIAGYCEDAKLAVELARALEAKGEAIAALLMIDAVWHLAEGKGPSTLSGRGRRLVRNLSRHGLDFIIHRLQRRRKYAVENLKLLVSHAEMAARGALGLERPLEVEHRVLVRHYYEALAAYAGPPYDGRVQHFVAAEWDAVPGEVGDDVTIIPGYHDEIFEGGGLAALAAGMQSALAEADAQHRAGAQARRQQRA